VRVTHDGVELTFDNIVNDSSLYAVGLFVPLHFRSRERKDHRENFRSRGTFAPGDRKVQELSFYGTFAPVELSLLRSECSKNFRSMELSHPWNLRSTNNFRAL